MRGRPATVGNGWGLAEAAGGFVAGLLLALVAASAAAGAVGYTEGHGAMPVAVTVADVVGLWVGMVGGTVLASRRHGQGSLVADYGLRVAAWWDLVAGAALGVACQYLLVPALYLPFEQVFPHLAHQLSAPAHQDVGAAHGWGQVILLLVVLGAGSPIVEELFFRGLVLRALLGRMPTAVAIVVTALLFGLAHFEAIQFAGLAVFGAVLGLLAWWTGRLGPGIAAHAAFNVSAVIAIAKVH